MKRCFLIWFVAFFISIVSYAQEAHYELSINGTVYSTGSSCGGNIKGGLQWVAAEFENGTHETLAQGTSAYPDNGIGIRNQHILSNSISFTEANKVIKLKLRTTRRGTTLFGSCKSSEHKNTSILINTCVTQNYDFYSLSLNQPGNINTIITPKITLPTPFNNNIGSDHLLNILPITGIADSFFNWEYSFNGTSWVNFPSSLQNKNFISSIASEILSESTGNNHGKNIYIRVNTNCNNSFSNVIIYNYKISAPNISSKTVQKVQCFDSLDGSVKINFDRSLITGEKLTYSLNNTNGDTFNLPDGISITGTPDGINYTLEADNSYTIENLPPGNYTIRLLGAAPGGYNGNMFTTYTDSPTHTTTFTINKPDPVEFSTTQVDVWCNGSSDGEITITAEGGIPKTEPTAFYRYKVIDTNPFINGDFSEDWTTFSNANQHVITGLPKDTYTIMVQDSNGCIAKVIQRDGSGQIVGLGTEIAERVEITEPSAPVRIEFPNDGYQEPTAFGFSNGFITAKINGGTPLANGTYNYTWTHENGTVWSTFSKVLNADGWFLILENAIAGTYSLTITDANYSSTLNKVGCTILGATFTLNEPPLLSVSISETNAISCHSGNTFSDPSSDGELTATATGGVPFSPLIGGQHAYKYTWKKKNFAGVFQTISGKNSRVLSDINAGEYAVNIEDANGITVGTATNNVVSPVPTLYTITQPELLQITLTKVDVFCNAGNDGSIDATITGGTGNYTINWNTGATTEDIDTLTAGTYTINVTDAKGCQAQATIGIDEPKNPLEITHTFFEPTFAGATNGWIETTITGGTSLDTGAYTYTWEDSNGTNINAQATTTINSTNFVIKVSGLGKGVYHVTIKDKNYPVAINPTNCTIINSSYELFEPDILIATIQLHTPISCNSTNTYGNPFSDGALEVTAQGGVQLQPTDNNGLKYYYTWKKETSPGVWTVLTSQTTNIATNLEAGTYAVNIEDANGIVLGVYQNNVLVSPTDVPFLFEEPPLLEVDIEKQDVYCFNGSDSWAKAIVTGGIAPYSIVWDNGDTTAQTDGLSQGIYEVSITDSRGCQVASSIQINQPTVPIHIEYTAFATPATGNAADGWIKAQISGGTDFADGRYTYYWKDNTGTILNTQTTTRIVNNIFEIHLNNIPKGNYYLTIEDANFPLATTKEGCTFLESEFRLYDPIEAIIGVETPISCHQNNTFNNPFSDGALQVTVTGGVPFETGQPYLYYWKKENSFGGFDHLNQNSAIATGLSHGNYRLNVADSRGVVIGIYESLHLIDATDVPFLFEEPDLLEVSLTNTEISCDAGNDATATAHITGGIAPYTIQWSNQQNGITATNLIAGNHMVYITDARGCQVTGNIYIDQPGGLEINVTEETPPTCFQGNNGTITVALSGGTAPYTYAWNTGATTTSISNLPQGRYTFSLTDANGCSAFKEITLEDPENISIDLGIDKTLCKDQTYPLDARISDPTASYVWTSTNGFSATTPQIIVSEAGTYQVTATSSLGCTATDTVVISYKDIEIDAEFLLPSQAYVYQDIVLFNVSSPLGDSSEWVFPENTTIVAETATSITVHFSEAGTYEVSLISTQGDCSQGIYKNIVVEENNNIVTPKAEETVFIKDFGLLPNPNNGQFKLHVELAKPSPIAIRMFTIQGSFILEKKSEPINEEYTIPMNLNLPSGIYLLILETAKQTQVKRVIIN